MRSLFVKIFLWFWLASIVIIGSTIVLMSVVEPHKPFKDEGRLVKRLSREGQRAVNILENKGHAELRKFMHGKRKRPGRHVFLFNDKNEALTGRHVPPEAMELSERASNSGVTEYLHLKRSFMLARPVYGSDGEAYVVISEIPRRPRESPVWRYLNPRFLSLRLLVIFIVASIFCYWLAWYLTSPIRKLRTASQQLASGDMKTRVVPEMGSRSDELADLGKDFDLMAGRIESLLSSQGRLLRDISHELRSPLARLNVALELARQRSGKEAEEALDRIEREAERMNTLIGQLRTLTLLEGGNEIMDKKTIYLSNLVKSISGDTEFESSKRNISIKTALDENIMIEGSEELLRRAIENVLRNALRYTAEGSVIEMSLKKHLSEGKEHALLKVRDHGPGVNEDELVNLFNPFYRVAESRDRKSGGMGIGLAITDRAVKLHGGTVKAFNAAEGGLVVQIEIPISL